MAQNAQHVSMVEERVQLLVEHLNGIMGIAQSAVTELERIMADVGGRAGNAAPSTAVDTNPFDLLHGNSGAGFQPRSLQGPWGPASPHAGFGAKLPCLLEKGSFQAMQQQQVRETTATGAAAAATSATNSLQPTIKGDTGDIAAASGSEALLETQVLDADAMPPHAQLLDDAVIWKQRADAINASPATAFTTGAAGLSSSQMQLQQQQQQVLPGASSSSLPDAASDDVADTDSGDSRHLHVPSESAEDQDADSSSLNAPVAPSDEHDAISGEAAAASGQQEATQSVVGGPAMVEVAEDDATHTCMLRIAYPDSPHGRRTMATYTNDEVGLTDQDGLLARNTDIPYELLRPEPYLASHLHDAMSWVLAHLSHDRRKQGWTHQLEEQQEQEEEDEGEELLDEPLPVMMELNQQDMQQSVQQQQQQSGEQDQHTLEQQQGSHQEEDEAISLAAGRGAVVSPGRRKQAKPVRKPHAAPDRAADRALELSSDTDDDQQPQTRHSALASLLQHLAAAPTAAGAGHTGAGTAGAGSGRHDYAGMPNAAQLAEMQVLVQEDVERLQQQWREKEMPKLQQCAADIWEEQRLELAYWRQVVDQRQAQLDKGVHELVISNADNIAMYKRHRHRLCEAIHEWVFLLEGASYVLSVVQLPTPPAPAEVCDVTAAEGRPTADTAGQVTREACRKRSTPDSDNQQDRIDASSASDEADFIDDSDDDSQHQHAVNVVAAAETTADQGAGSSSRSGDGATEEDGQDNSSEDSKGGAWNVPHVMTGATQVLQPGRRLRRLHRQAELTTTQEQATPQQQQQHHHHHHHQIEADSAGDSAAEPAAAAGADGVAAAPNAVSPAARLSPDGAAEVGTPAQAAAAGVDFLPAGLEDGVPGELLEASKSSDMQDGQPDSDEQQQQQQGSPSADDLYGMSAEELERVLEAVTDGEQVTPASPAAKNLPAGDYMYSELVAKESVQERCSLQLLQPCEVLAASNGGETVSFKLMDLQQYNCQLPRWHTWETARGVAALSQSVGVVRVLKQSGPMQQVLLANVRPSPPAHLASIMPATVQQEQHREQGDGNSGACAPLSAAAAAWANSDAGLLHLAKALRPGTLLEYHSRHRGTAAWVPALVLHSTIVRPALSSQLKQEILMQSKHFAGAREPCSWPCCERQVQHNAGQEHPQAAEGHCKRVTAAGLVAAGKWMREGRAGRPAARYQAPQPDECVLVLQLLGAKRDVRHIKWHMLCGASPSLRYMLHWQPRDECGAELSDGLADAETSPQSSSGARDGATAATGAATPADAGADALAHGSWQRLTHLRFYWLHRAVRAQLYQEHKAWLKPFGWPQRGRRRCSMLPDDRTLAETAVAAIARKLARRPTAAAISPALAAAAGYGRDSRRQKRHHVQRRELLGKSCCASEDGVGSVGGAGRKGSKPQRTAEGEHRAGHRRKLRHQQVLTDASESGDDVQPAAKRVCVLPRLRPRRGAVAASRGASSSAEGSSDADDDMGHRVRAEGRSRRAAAARGQAGSSNSGGVEASLPSDYTEAEAEYEVSEAGSEEMQADSGDAVLLFDRPEGPLNPRLPKSWFSPGLPADKQVLKQHQLEGLRFMWNCLVTEHANDPDSTAAGDDSQAAGKRSTAASDDDDFVDGATGKHSTRSKKGKENRRNRRGADASNIDDAGGCILAHSMGLGKSFQTIALLWLYFQKLDGRALLVVPTNVVPNWADEFEKWLPGSMEPEARSSSLRKSKVYVADRKQSLLEVLPKWRHGDGAVLITSYGVFNNAVKQEGQAAAAAARSAHLAPASSGPSGRRGSVENSMDGPAGSGADQDDDICADAEGGSDAEIVPLELPRRKSAAEIMQDIRDALLKASSIIVADEAHQMKNAKALTCRTMGMLKSRRRLALTGYPLQNNMEEYYQMIAWVQPEDVFMTAADFKSKFTDPITAGQRGDASRAQRIKMARQLSVLQDRTAHFIQRAGPEILVRDLPPKHEFVLALGPTPTQRALLKELVDILDRKGRSLFRDMELMRKILCTRDHGYAVLSKAVAVAQAGQRVALETGEEDMQLIIESQQLPDAGPSGLGPLRHDSTQEPQITMSQEGDVLQQGAAKAPEQRSARPAGSAKVQKSKQQAEKLPIEIIEELLQAYPQEIIQQQQDSGGNSSSGGSAVLLPKEAFIRHLVASCCEGEQQEKVVVFSQSIPVLTALASLLEAEFGYKAGREYLRLQGEVSASRRSELIAKFNRQGSSSKVFLISTRAGSVGINLVAARRLVLYDIPWNPVHNKQAVSRIWRYGQSQSCYLYHLMYYGTIEQHLYERTLEKLELFARVVERQHKRRATISPTEAQNLYTLLPAAPLSREQLAAAVEAKVASNSTADNILRNMLQQDATVESLKLVRLDNHEEQLQEDPAAKLTKEEKMRAAIEYERERRRSQAPPTGAAAGGDGSAARAARAERRWRQRLITTYGTDFESKLQQQEQEERQQREQARREAAASVHAQQQHQQQQQQHLQRVAEMQQQRQAEQQRLMAQNMQTQRGQQAQVKAHSMQQQRPPPASLQVMQQMRQQQGQPLAATNNQHLQQGVLPQQQAHQAVVPVLVAAPPGVQAQATHNPLTQAQAAHNPLTQAQRHGLLLTLQHSQRQQQQHGQMQSQQLHLQALQRLLSLQAAQATPPAPGNGVATAGATQRMPAAAGAAGGAAEPPAKRVRSDSSVPGFSGGSSSIQQQQQQALENRAALRQGSQVEEAAIARQRPHPAAPAQQQQQQTTAAPQRQQQGVAVVAQSANQQLAAGPQLHVALAAVARQPQTAGMPPPQAATVALQPQAAATAAAHVTPAAAPAQTQATPTSPSAAATATLALEARTAAAQATAANEQQWGRETKVQLRATSPAGADVDQIDLTQDD